MWTKDMTLPANGFLTPPATWKSRPSQSRRMPLSDGKKSSSSPANKDDLFHIIHKVPSGNSPYVKAKQVQLIEKDPSRAVSMFWAAINAGDRVESALKDMALVMKQLNRSDEAIEAIKSFRLLCPSESQESLDNILIELYKRSGRIDEEIEMLQRKLNHIEEGASSVGRRTKPARSQGKKIQVTVEQEISRILGNLAWAYLQKEDYRSAEEHYRKALSLELDRNKQCNLAICLMQMNKITEAKVLLHAVRAATKNRKMDDSFAKSFERAYQMLNDLESKPVTDPAQQKVENQNRSSKGNQNSINVSPGQVAGVNEEGGKEAVLENGQKGECYRGTYLGDRKKDNSSATSGVEVAFSNHKTLCSPVPTRRNMNVPYAQIIRRCPWGYSDGCQRRENWGDASFFCSNDKIPFKDKQAQKRVTSFHSCRTLDWTKALDDFSEIQYRNTALMGTHSERTVNMEWNKNFLGKDESAESKQALPADSQDMVLNDSTVESDKSLKGSFSYSVELTNSVGQNNLECTKLGVKKSWADMAEEEEEEEFNDENLNSNIINQCSYFQNHTESSNQKHETFDPEDRYTASWDSNFSRKPTVRRSLCFENQLRPAFCASSSSPKEASSFEGNRMQETERDSISWEKINLMRRNRLKVFQDITLGTTSSS